MRTFIGVVFVLTAIAVGAAFYTGIVAVSAEREENKFIARVQVNTVPVQRTIATRIDEITELRDLTGTQTTQGFVSEYEDGAPSFVLATMDHREVSIYVDPATRVTGSRLNGLLVGDRVTVTYKTANGQNTATSVAIE